MPHIWPSPVVIEALEWHLIVDNIYITSTNQKICLLCTNREGMVSNQVHPEYSGAIVNCFNSWNDTVRRGLGSGSFKLLDKVLDIYRWANVRYTCSKILYTTLLSVIANGEQSFGGMYMGEGFCPPPHLGDILVIWRLLQNVIVYLCIMGE